MKIQSATVKTAVRLLRQDTPPRYRSGKLLILGKVAPSPEEVALLLPRRKEISVDLLGQREGSLNAMKKQITKPMLVRMRAEEQEILSKRAVEAGSSLSRYLIECGLFECGLRRGILTTEDRQTLEFLAFLVARARTDLKLILKRLVATSPTVDVSSVNKAIAELDGLTGTLKRIVGE